jgi:pre-mRNA-splicing factor 18
MMDAMTLLKNEINKKRKITEDLIKDRRGGAAEGEVRGEQEDGERGVKKSIRYFRQSDLIKKEEEEQLERIRERELIHKNSQIQTAAEEAAAHLLEKNKENQEADHQKESEILQKLLSLTVDEVKNRLRNLGHPVTLFGESPTERTMRLASAQTEEEDDDYRLTAIGHETKLTTRQQNQSNNSLTSSSSSFPRKKPPTDEDDEDDDEEEEVDRATRPRGGGGGGGGSGTEGEDGHISHEHSSSSSSSFIRGNIRTNYASASSGLSSEKIIYKYFRNLLKQWEWDLDDRDDYLKQTAKGKMETRTQKQCKDYIRPLFKLCKRKEVPGDILIKLVQVGHGD